MVPPLMCCSLPARHCTRKTDRAGGGSGSTRAPSRHDRPPGPDPLDVFCCLPGNVFGLLLSLCPWLSLSLARSSALALSLALALTRSVSLSRSSALAFVGSCSLMSPLDDACLGVCWVSALLCPFGPPRPTPC